jgi:hypothetical protein
VEEKTLVEETALAEETRRMSIRQIEAGGVGSVTTHLITHKVAQNNHIPGDLVLASPTQARYNCILAGIPGSGVARLIDEVKPKFVMNAGRVHLG